MKAPDWKVDSRGAAIFMQYLLSLLLGKPFPPPPAQLAKPRLVLLTNNSFDAKCLDGSPPGYYFRAGTGGGKRMWNINLPGGGWCSSAAECVARSKTFYGSSTFYPGEPTRIPPFPRFAGFLSSNSSVNPPFHNWNLVRLIYCDGGGYLGTAGRLEVSRGTVLYMDGWKIVQAVIEDLKSKGEIQSATHILLSGTSAGGQAALSLCDRIAATFPWAATKCLCDSGNFIDSQDRMGGNTWRDTVTNMVALHKPTWRLPR
ncbi:unnamed protein product, partial [Closterium sp. Naga37s-1]